MSYLLQISEFKERVCPNPLEIFTHGNPAPLPGETVQQSIYGSVTVMHKQQVRRSKEQEQEHKETRNMTMSLSAGCGAKGRDQLRPWVSL